MNKIDEKEPTPEKIWNALVEAHEVREALLKLDLRSQRAIYMRFWNLETIEDISKELGMTWDGADRCINQALESLRKFLPQEIRTKNLDRPAA